MMLSSIETCSLWDLSTPLSIHQSLKITSCQIRFVSTSYSHFYATHSNTAWIHLFSSVPNKNKIQELIHFLQKTHTQSTFDFLPFFKRRSMSCHPPNDSLSHYFLRQQALFGRHTIEIGSKSNDSFSTFHPRWVKWIDSQSIKVMFCKKEMTCAPWDLFLLKPSTVPFQWVLDESLENNPRWQQPSFLNNLHWRLFFLVIASLKDKSSDADTLGCFFTVFVYRVHIKQRVSFGNTQAFSVSLDLWKTAVTCLLWT